MSFSAHILLFYIFCFTNSDLGYKLIFVGLHFRHGARAPQNIGNDFYDMLKEKWTNPDELVWNGPKNALFIRPKK